MSGSVTVLLGLRSAYNGAAFHEDEVAVRTATAIDRVVEEAESTALGIVT